MGKEHRPLDSLSAFLPAGGWEAVAPYFSIYNIHLTLTRHRKSLHGDYRVPSKSHPYHRISVNATLNPYSFLMTLLHELAHLTTVVRYGLKPAPHGAEWKTEFRAMLAPALQSRLFPPDVAGALTAYFTNPAASTCTDPALYKALSRYDAGATAAVHVSDLPAGAAFTLNDRRFQKIETLRTRARCKELSTGRIYFVSGVALVQVFEG